MKCKRLFNSLLLVLAVYLFDTCIPNSAFAYKCVDLFKQQKRSDGIVYNLLSRTTDDVVIPANKLLQNNKISSLAYENYSVNHIARSLIKTIESFERKNLRFLNDDQFASIDLKAEADIMLFFKSKRFQSIQQKGFLNQHQTGFSQGVYAPEKRVKFEDALLGIELGQTMKAKTLRPKSAFLNIRSHDRSQLLEDLQNLYGDVAAVMKPSVRERSLWVAGDSMGVGIDLLNINDRADSEQFRVKHRGTFSRERFPKKSRSWAYQEVLIYGDLGIKDVDYFLVGDKNLVESLKSANLPIYMLEIDTRFEKNDTVVYRKGEQLFSP